MDIKAFIQDINSRPDFRDVVHHEEFPVKEALYAETAEPLPTALKSAVGRRLRREVVRLASGRRIEIRLVAAPTAI